MDPIPYSKPWIIESDRKACADALTDAIITRGPLVEAFEKEVAAYCQAPFAVAFNSGTSALSAAYFAANLNPFDTLITSPNTFVGTVTGALLQGAKVKFSDIDPETGNLDLRRLPRVQKSRGKQVIVPNHFAGSPVELKTLATGHHDLIIEDACHAFGGCYANGLPVGSDPHVAMTAFSFHPTKTITMGEGGMVVTHHEEYVARLKKFRNNGITYSKGLHLVQTSYATGNFNVTEMQAALGLNQLKRTDQIVAKRGKLVSLYKELLPHISMVPHSSYSAYHLLCILLKRDQQSIMEALKKEGIHTQIHYIPLYRQPLFKQKGLPHCDEYSQSTLTLPLYYELTEKDVERIAKALLKAIGE